MEKDLDRLMALFAGFAGAHGTHGLPTQDGLKWIIKPTARTVREPVTRDTWKQHLAGKRPLGVMPIREDSTCSWGSIDVDEYDVDIVEIVQKVEAAKMPLVPCRSKSGGLHLFLFLLKPFPASEVQNVLTDAAASLGLAGCEIFPKQTRVVPERGDLPNWIIAPYFGSTYDGKLQWQHGLKKNGADMSLSEFLKYAESMKCELEILTALCTARRAASQTKPSGEKRKRGKSPCDFSDGPPCLEYLASSGVQKEGRKRTLFMEAIYLKRAAPDDEWKSKLEAMNQRFDPPLPSSEIDGVIKSVEKKEYHYTCKQEPMVSHCNSRACRQRKFGVGSGGELEPVVSSITRVGTDPPLWIVVVESVTLELATRELQSYRLFHEACVANMLVFPPMKDAAWFALLSEAMKKVVVEEAPPDAAPGGQFLELMEEFLTNRPKGDRKEDLLSNRSWENVDDGRWYFKLESFEVFLRQQNVRRYEGRGRLTQAIKHLGGGSKEWNITNRSGGSVRTWYVPTEVIPRTGALETPPRKREPI